MRYGRAAIDLDCTNDLISAHVVANLDRQAIQRACYRGNDVHDVASHLRIVGRIEIVVVIEQVPGNATDNNDHQNNNYVDENYPTHIRILILSCPAGDIASNGNMLMLLFTMTKHRIRRACCQFGSVLDDSSLKLRQETNKQNALLMIH